MRTTMYLSPSEVTKIVFLSNEILQRAGDKKIINDIVKLQCIIAEAGNRNTRLKLTEIEPIGESASEYLKNAKQQP